MLDQYTHTHTHTTLVTPYRSFYIFLPLWILLDVFCDDAEELMVTALQVNVGSRPRPGCEHSCDSPFQFCLRNWIKEPRRNDQNYFWVEQWVTLNGSAGNPPGLATTARRRVIALKGRYAEVVTRSSVRDENQATWIVSVCGCCHVLQHRRGAVVLIVRTRVRGRKQPAPYCV